MGLALLLVMAGVVALVLLGGKDDSAVDERQVRSAPAPASTGTDPGAAPSSGPSEPTTPTAPPAPVIPVIPDPVIPDPDLAAARASTSAAAREFTEVLNTYGPADLRGGGTMGDYRARVAALLTPGFASIFRRSMGPVETRVAGSGLRRSGEIGQVGVAVLKRTTAQVVVAGRITTSIDDMGPESFDLFLDVSLTRLDGDWRVDDLAILSGRPGPGQLGLGLGGAPGARTEPGVAAARARRCEPPR